MLQGIPVDCSGLDLQVEQFCHELCLFRITLPVASERPTPPFDHWALLARLAAQTSRDLLVASFRGVEPRRLATVLRSGIDVEPPDAPIFASSFDKAWEYGGWPKLMLALDAGSLHLTFLEVRADIPPHELAAHRSRFPTIVRNEDGQMLWLSRFSTSDRYVASPYEAAYGRWIPGDARKALRAVLFFTSLDQPNGPDALDEALAGAQAAGQPWTDAMRVGEPQA